MPIFAPVLSPLSVAVWSGEPGGLVVVGLEVGLEVGLVLGLVVGLVVEVGVGVDIEVAWLAAARKACFGTESVTPVPWQLADNVS